MRKRILLIVLAATMLVLAGCSGGTPADGGASPEDGTADGEDGADGSTGGDTATGTVEFYVSDQPGRMDDFRHLNVTIDRIGFERADGGSEATPTVTVTATNATTTNATATATATNATATATATATAAAEESESEENESEESESAEDESEEDDAGGKIVRDVDARSVDLTQLRGANATLIGTPQIPAGEYTKVTVYISEVNATLQDGTSANVKLPSNTLKLTKGFSLAPNGTVQFVYDISVFEAGNSGKYILKPVISESGPDKEMKVVDDSDDAERDDSDAATDSEETEDDADEPEGTGNGTDGAGGPPDDRGN